MAKVRAKKLCVTFVSEAAFVSEYRNNIANGGIFLATNKAFEIRDPVVIELRLEWCDEAVRLRGEVVHSIPAELASTGVVPGVAVQFALEGSELREKFGVVAHALTQDPDDNSGNGRRESTRTMARVEAAIRVDDGSDITARTRDISKTGVLLATDGAEMPVGQSLAIDLTHPISGEQMTVPGKVVRQVRGKDGSITALGVEFDVADETAPELGRFVDRVKATEHSRRLGIISGTIDGYGCERLLRMFASAAPQGTFTVFRHGDEGAIVFNESGFVAAYVGHMTDRAALGEILRWQDGDFEFEMKVEKIFRDSVGRPLEDVLDEVKGMSARGVRSTPVQSAGSGSSLLDKTIQVDVAALDSQARELSKSEEAVIDLAIVGMVVRKVVQIIPEPESQVMRAIETLLEQGLIVIDS